MDGDEPRGEPPARGGDAPEPLAPAPDATPPDATAPGGATGEPRFSQPSPGEDASGEPASRRPRRLVPVLAGVLAVALVGAVAAYAGAALGSDPAMARWQGAEVPEPVPTEAPPRPITLSAVGDMIIGSYNFGLPPNGGAGFFDPVKAALAADVVMGNVEQALTEPTGYTKCGPESASCYAYAAPTSYAGRFRDAGFTLVTVNNNHTNDYGPQGRANTRSALAAAGIAVTGGVDEITYVEAGGLTLAAIGFSPYTWGANLNDTRRAVELVTQAAARADLVVVQFHGGAEGADRTHVLPAGQSEYAFGENRGDLRTFTHAVVDAGADLVIGHGPHVLRGIEFYQGRLIAYSLGNFAGYRALNASGRNGVGAILKVSLHRDGTWAGGSLTATEMVSPGMPALDTDGRALAFVDELGVQDFGARAVRVDRTTGQLTVPA